MASNASSWYSISGHSSRKYRAYVNAYVQSQTDTTATIYVEGCVQAYYLSQYGAGIGVYINGQWVDGASVAIMNPGGDVGSWGWASGTLTIDKASYGMSITCMCSVWGETVSGYGGLNGGNPSTSVTVPVSAITIYEPNEPSDLTNTRESDNKNVLTWEVPSTSATQPVSAILIERSVDGGEWSQVEIVGGTATSYADTTTAADHYYRYRVRSQNGAGYSGYSTSGYTYNTPAAPSKVTASRLAQNTVGLAIENAARTATGLDLQRSADGEQWTDIPSVSGSPVTEATDAPGGGTFWYRARNTRGELVSDWSPASNAVVTITPPNAPTLVSPASGVVVSKAQEQVLFQWLHNPVDGSAQTAAELRYSLDGGQTWQVVEISGNAASYGLSNAFAVNSTVTWGVRTKGADEDFGPWSGNRSFNVYQEPMVAFAQPTDGFVVENTPIALKLQYEDPSGELVSAAMSISDGSRVVWSRTVSGTDYVITADEWVPDNYATYYATAEVRSSSSLTASASRAFATAFVPPVPAGVTVENDVETGFARLSVYLDDTDPELEPAKSVTVYREVAGVRVLLGEGLQPGAGLVDRYAPVNVDYSYAVVSVADSGAVSTTYVPARLDSQWFYFIWGENVAKGRVNPEGSKKLTRPNRRRRHFANRPSPVSFDDGSVGDSRSVSVLLRTKAESDAFEQMMWQSARCVYKSADGDVLHADVELSDKPAWQAPTYYGSVSVSITRIDGRAL